MKFAELKSLIILLFKFKFPLIPPLIYKSPMTFFLPSPPSLVPNPCLSIC